MNLRKMHGASYYLAARAERLRRLLKFAEVRNFSYRRSTRLSMLFRFTKFFKSRMSWRCTAEVGRRVRVRWAPPMGFGRRGRSRELARSLL